MLTLQKVVAGIGSVGSNCYKDIYKAARGCMTDRSMNVRVAAAKVIVHDLWFFDIQGLSLLAPGMENLVVLFHFCVTFTLFSTVHV